MKPLEQVSPEEQTALVMENDLLRYEIRHLRGRLSATDAEITRLRASGGSGTPAPGARPRGVSESERRVRNDMVWLLRRLDRSPLRLLYARRAGFISLRERYLDAS